MQKNTKKDRGHEIDVIKFWDNTMICDGNTKRTLIYGVMK